MCKFKIFNMGVFVVFEVVVCYESFMYVVKELFLIESVVLWQIVMLEVSFGVWLFVCVKQCVVLMCVGKLYGMQVWCVLEVFDCDMLLIIVYGSGGGYLEFVVLLIFVLYWLILCIKSFYDCMFDVCVNMGSCIDLFLFEDMYFEVVIYYGKLMWFGMLFDYLFGEEVVLICLFVLLNGLVECVEDLFVYLLLYLMMCFGVWVQWFEMYGVEDICMMQGVCYELYMMLISVVVVGFGVVFVLKFFVEEQLQ